jgi:hypothetical protein
LLSRRDPPNVSRVERAKPKPLPDFTPDRLVDRIAEAIQVGMDPAKLDTFPAWTQRVMRILKEQLIPPELDSIVSADKAVFAEGVAIAWAARARDRHPAQVAPGLFGRKLAERLSLDTKTQEVADQVETGAFVLSPEFQQHVIHRLFAPDFAARRAFAEGLAVGNRLPELLDGQAQRGTTDATAIYLMLWFYWPEISERKSVGEVARALEPFFAGNKNLAGLHWAERFRKLANRLGLSFRATQSRRRKIARA